MTALVEARGLGVTFGRSWVLDSVDLTVRHGDQVALLGRSGSGKSTLLLALAGLLPAQRGAVSWPGLSADPVARRAQLAMVFQAPSLLAELTAEQNVALPLRLRGQTQASAYSAARRALLDVGLADASGALPDELSGGQQQRVALARALAGRPLVVLADEPTGALDRASGQHVLAVLREHVLAVGGALLLATHDPELAEALPGRLELRDGRLVATSVPVALAPATAGTVRR
ncbi:MAG: transporter ATP-binding protein [Frankiales bacterium]|jgi:ABC-type lipoprotein export system ATPase subunit|nr:transporter ATP-binding protein [Frankiales bacterium]